MYFFYAGLSNYNTLSGRKNIYYFTILKTKNLDMHGVAGQKSRYWQGYMPFEGSRGDSLY